jgi:glycosyltransferase involved in cell wall biosynthesis
MDNILVSILIPVYNRENLIENTVKSAINQTYKNIEIIIVDNKSTDNTWLVLEKLAIEDERIKIFQNHTNVGPVRNWKRCIDEARGAYGKILWSDDLIASDFLEKTITLLSDNNIGFVFTGTEIFFDNSDRKIYQHFIGDSGVYDIDEYLNGVLLDTGGYPASPGCALFRLKDLKQNLLLNIPNKINSDFSSHAIGNDLLLFLLTAKNYKKFAFVNEKLSFFRSHSDSITVKSIDGQLRLFYTLTSSYFVENYRKDLIRKMNTRIYLIIKKFKLGSKRYNLDSIENFYLTNNDFKLDRNYLLKLKLKKIFRI